MRAGPVANSRMVGHRSGAQVITIDTAAAKGRANIAGRWTGSFSRSRRLMWICQRLRWTPRRDSAGTRLQAEQGFAKRPFPRGHKGLTLEANGKLEPAGESYLNMVINEGLSPSPVRGW